MNFELGPDKLPGTYEVDYNRFTVVIPSGHVLSWNCLDWPASVNKMSAESVWGHIGEAVEWFMWLLC